MEIWAVGRSAVKPACIWRGLMFPAEAMAAASKKRASTISPRNPALEKSKGPARLTSAATSAGCRALQIPASVPPMQYPSTPTFGAPVARRTARTARPSRSSTSSHVR